MSVLAVFLAGLATALATGLGALPFFVFRHPGRVSLGVANALASGFMAGASARLFWEAATRGPLRTIAGAVLGVAFIQVSRRRLGARPEAHLGRLVGADARAALLIIGVMTVHSFSEGIGIGVSFGGGNELGVFITAAIAIHNIPEGLAISLVLVPRGARALSAAGWSVFSSLPQPLMAVPAFLFVESFKPVLPLGLAFAGGAMVWMVAADLVPEALEHVSWRVVALVGVGSTFAMLALQAALS